MGIRYMKFFGTLGNPTRAHIENREILSITKCI